MNDTNNYNIIIDLLGINRKGSKRKGSQRALSLN